MVWRCPTHDVYSIDDLCPHCQRVIDARKQLINDITQFLKTTKYSSKADIALLKACRRALKKIT